MGMPRLFDWCLFAGDEFYYVFNGAGCGEVVDRFGGYAAKHCGDGDDCLGQLRWAEGMVLRIVGSAGVSRGCGV
jgi:hypothetical protein